MAARNKKKSSPNRARSRQRKVPPRNAVRPIDFDKDKYDNKPFDVYLNFEGNIELTLAFQGSSVQPTIFQSGVDSPSLHVAFKNSLLNALESTLAPLFGQERLHKDVRESLASLVEQRYLPNATGDSRYFRWSIHPAHGNSSQRFSPVALTKYFSTMKDARIGVTCHMPDDFEAYIYGLTTSIFADKSVDRNDEFYASSSALLSPSMRSGFDIYQHLKETRTSPFKSFDESICRGPDGFWTSSNAPVLTVPNAQHPGFACSSKLTRVVLIWHACVPSLR